MKHSWCAIIILATTLWAASCGKPRFTYDIPAGAKVEHHRTISLDPRKDYIFPFEGKHQVSDPEFQRLVLEELQARGYRIVPAEEAELWVNAFLYFSVRQERSVREGAHGVSSSMSHGGIGHGGHSSGRGNGNDHQSEEPHSGGGGLTVLVEIAGRSSHERVWFGMVDVIPTKRGSHGSGHNSSGVGNTSLEDTVKRLLMPLPACTIAINHH